MTKKSRKQFQNRKKPILEQKYGHFSNGQTPEDGDSPVEAGE